MMIRFFMNEPPSLRIGHLRGSSLAVIVNHHIFNGSIYIMTLMQSIAKSLADYPRAAARGSLPCLPCHERLAQNDNENKYKQANYVATSPERQRGDYG
jgi:hypothetical protein